MAILGAMDTFVLVFSKRCNPLKYCNFIGRRIQQALRCLVLTSTEFSTTAVYDTQHTINHIFIEFCQCPLKNIFVISGNIFSEPQP